VDGFGALQLGKYVDGFAGPLLGEAQVVEVLKIGPELGAGAEEMGEAQGRVAGDRAGAVQDLLHAVRWYVDLSPELGALMSSASSSSARCSPG